MTKDWEEPVEHAPAYHHLSNLILSTMLDIVDIQRLLLDLSHRRLTVATEADLADLDQQSLTTLFDLLDLHREVVDLVHRIPDETLQSRALQQLSALVLTMEGRPRRPGTVRTVED